MNELICLEDIFDFDDLLLQCKRLTKGLDLYKGLHFYLECYDCADDKLLQQEIKKLESKNTAKIHTAMQFVLSDDYLQELYEEYYLSSAYILAHGSEDEYYVKLQQEFLYVNDYVSNILHLDCYYYWQMYYVNVFRKIERIKNKIDFMIQNKNDTLKPYFLTLTLNDNYWLTPRTITRASYTDIRTRIRKYVKEYSDLYILNKDFGLNESKRLHFHGVFLMPKGYYTSFVYHYSKKFGFCKLEIIDDHSDYISRYIQKLSKHAMKVNYGFNRENLIFSRNFKGVIC